MTKRILKRAAESGRLDDNQEILKRRFETHKNKESLVIEHFRRLNKLVTVFS
jgi:UMP-CMP kinase